MKTSCINENPENNAKTAMVLDTKELWDINVKVKTLIAACKIIRLQANSLIDCLIDCLFIDIL